MSALVMILHGVREVARLMILFPLWIYCVVVLGREEARQERLRERHGS